jgi:uncharacterized protein YdhG (YjbR/CyaY superfamily)
MEYQTVEEYIALQPDQIRPTLEHLRATIKNAAPGAAELISYQMPAFRFHGMVVWYAAFKNHYSLFFRPRVLQVFKDRLSMYPQTKSAVKIPLSGQFPEQLLTEIIKYAMNENQCIVDMKTAAKKKARGK